MYTEVRSPSARDIILLEMLARVIKQELRRELGKMKSDAGTEATQFTVSMLNKVLKCSVLWSFPCCIMLGLRQQ